jgi:hypothetical protein
MARGWIVNHLCRQHAVAGKNNASAMPRAPRHLPKGYSFHITLRCNSRQFLIAKGLRRDVLLAVLAKAKQKYPCKVYA